MPRLPKQPGMGNVLNHQQFSALSRQWRGLTSTAAVNISTVCRAAVGHKPTPNSVSVRVVHVQLSALVSIAMLPKSVLSVNALSKGACRHATGKAAWTKANEVYRGYLSSKRAF